MIEEVEANVLMAYFVRKGKAKALYLLSKHVPQIWGQIRAARRNNVRKSRLLKTLTGSGRDILVESRP